MRGKYHQRHDGEWCEPKGRYHKIECCDCGLIHLFELRRDGRHIKFRAWRDNRATGQRRSAKRRRGEGVFANG